MGRFGQRFASLPRTTGTDSGTVTCILDGDEVIAVEAGDTADALFSASVDVGTTTLVLSLIDLSRGEEVAVASAMNEQVSRGDDVISRINYASSDKGLKEMRALIVRDINKLAKEAARTAGIAPTWPANM